MEGPRILDELQHLHPLAYGRRHGSQRQGGQNSDASRSSGKVGGGSKLAEYLYVPVGGYHKVSGRWHMKPIAAVFLLVLLAIPFLLVSGQQAGTTKLPVAVSSQQSRLTTLPL